MRVQRLERHGGFCVAANAGIAVASRPVVELLNDDTEVCSGWADEALTAFADASIGAVAPLVLRWPGGQPGAAQIDSAGDRYSLGGVAGKHGHGQTLSPEYLRPRFVFGASASSAFYRRTALLRVGGFPESFGTISRTSICPSDCTGPATAFCSSRAAGVAPCLRLLWRPARRRPAGAAVAQRRTGLLAQLADWRLAPRPAVASGGAAGKSLAALAPRRATALFARPLARSARVVRSAPPPPPVAAVGRHAGPSGMAPRSVFGGKLTDVLRPLHPIMGKESHGSGGGARP